MKYINEMIVFLVIVFVLVLVAKCCRQAEAFPQVSFDDLKNEKIEIPFERIDIEIWQSASTECEFPDNEYSMNVTQETEIEKIKERHIVDVIDGPITIEGTKDAGYILQSVTVDDCTIQTAMVVGAHPISALDDPHHRCVLDQKETKKDCIEPCVDPIPEETKPVVQEIKPQIKIPEEIKVNSGCMVQSTGATLFVCLLMFLWVKV